MEFLNDKPIIKVSDDLLNRYSFASRIAECLVLNQNKENLVISLNGKWGSGKTSILNMVKENIRGIKVTSKCDSIPYIIDFTPWNFLNQDDIIDQFFNTLLSNFKFSKLKKVLLSAGKITTDVIDEVLDYIPVPPSAIKAIKQICKAFKQYISAVENKSGDLVYKKEMVENNLKKSKIHFIVFIDDLDRLNNHEIKLIFQLIKSVCGFSNITYLLSYDKDIIGNALKNEQNGEEFVDGFKYLEKIVQVEFNVPEIKKEKIFEIVDKDLSILLKDKINDMLLSRIRTLVSYGLFKNFKTLREEKRFMNILGFCIDSYYGEIDLADLIGITYLRVMDEKIINLLIEYQNFILGNYYSDSSKIKDIEQSFYNELNTTRYKELDNNYLKQLFPNMFGNGSHYSGIPDDYMECRISKRDRFNLYLNLDLNSEDISIARLSDILKSRDIDSLVSYAKSLSKNQGRTFLMTLTSYSKNIDDNNIFKMLLDFVFCHLSEIDFAEELMLVGRDYFQEQICASALKKLDSDMANKLIMEAISNSNDVYSLITFSKDLESNKSDRLVELKNISDEVIDAIKERAFSLLIHKIDTNLDDIVDSATVINYGILKKGDEIKKILEKKDDYYHLNLLKKLIYVGYVSVSGSKSGRYNTYSFNLDNVKKVYSNEWINNISKLILNTNDRFFKMALIVLKMQIEEIQYKDPDIHSYSATQINSYCKENNIDFVASDDGWEHL